MHDFSTIDYALCSPIAVDCRHGHSTSQSLSGSACRPKTRGIGWHQGSTSRKLWSTWPQVDQVDQVDRQNSQVDSCVRLDQLRGLIITNSRWWCRHDEQKKCMVSQISTVLYYFRKLPSVVKWKLMNAYCSSFMAVSCGIWE